METKPAPSAGARGTAESFLDECCGRGGACEPLAIGGDAVEGNVGAGHGYGVAEEWAADVFGAVAEAAAGKSAILCDPIGGANCGVESFCVARRFVELRERSDGPAVFADVDVSVDTRDALLAALFVAKGEIFGAVLAFDDVGVLAGVEGAIGTGEECRKKLLDGLGGMKIFRVVPLRVGFGVDAKIFSLNGHDFFEVGLGPDAVGGILVEATPDRIEELKLRVESLARHCGGARVSA